MRHQRRCLKFPESSSSAPATHYTCSKSFREIQGGISGVQRHCFRTDPIVLRLRPTATPSRLYLTQELIQPFWSKGELERGDREQGDANSGKSNEATFGITLEGIPGVRWSELDRHGVGIGIGIGFGAKGLRKWSDGKWGAEKGRRTCVRGTRHGSGCVSRSWDCSPH